MSPCIVAFGLRLVENAGSCSGYETVLIELSITFLQPEARLAFGPTTVAGPIHMKLLILWRSSIRHTIEASAITQTKWIGAPRHTNVQALIQLSQQGSRSHRIVCLGVTQNVTARKQPQPIKRIAFGSGAFAQYICSIALRQTR